MDVENLIQKITEKTVKYKSPDWSTALTYDSTAQLLEPIYFWILDFMEGQGLKVEKLVDNFTASPGSGYFSDMGQRASLMQEKGMSLLKLLNELIKSLVALIHDLKLLELQIKDYEDAKSKDQLKKDAGLLSLKRRWTDEVDLKKGRGSILNMSQEAGFIGLMDAFMKADGLEDVDELPVNDRMKTIVKVRLKEFLDWWEKSETVKRKTYNIQKGYLKTQADTLSMYTRWVRPYLKAAEELRMKETKTPSLVSVFDTVILELSLFGKKPLNVKEEIKDENLPKAFGRAKIREFYPCVFIDFNFRSVPVRRSAVEKGGAYAYSGRVDIMFKTYALNEDEITLLRKEFREDDLKYVLGIARGLTDTGLTELKEDMDHFLRKEEIEAEEAKKREEGINSENPFGVIIESFAKLFKSTKKTKKIPEAEKSEEEKEDEELNKKIAAIEERGLRTDTYEEKIVRKLAKEKAKTMCLTLYDIYKKSHGMASYP